MVVFQGCRPDPTWRFSGLDLLQTTRIGRGIVSGRVALLLRSTEIKPCGPADLPFSFRLCYIPFLELIQLCCVHFLGGGLGRPNAYIPGDDHSARFGELLPIDEISREVAHLSFSRGNYFCNPHQLGDFPGNFLSWQELPKPH